MQASQLPAMWAGLDTSRDRTTPVQSIELPGSVDHPWDRLFHSKGVHT